MEDAEQPKDKVRMVPLAPHGVLMGLEVVINKLISDMAFIESKDINKLDHCTLSMILFIRNFFESGLRFCYENANNVMDAIRSMNGTVQEMERASYEHIIKSLGNVISMIKSCKYKNAEAIKAVEACIEMCIKQTNDVSNVIH